MDIPDHIWILSIDRNYFKVVRHFGKIAQTIGFSSNGEYYLHFTEGLYLLENGRAIIIDPVSGLVDNSRTLVSQFIENSTCRMKVYPNLKDLGYIIDFEAGKWKLFSPDRNFKKSKPPKCLGHIYDVTVDDCILDIGEEFCEQSAFLSLSDRSIDMIIRSTWTQLDPLFLEDECESFCIPKNEV